MLYYMYRSTRLDKEEAGLAKATTTIRQSLSYPSHYADYFAENAALCNRVVAFYFECIQAHEGILALTNKEALTALERLTHATEANLHPIMPLVDIAPDIPAMFRRAAINAVLGSASSFFSSLKKWRLHTPIEKLIAPPTKVVEQLTTTETRICAVDLNLDQHLAVCSVQTVEGTILATSFIGNGTAIAGTRRETARTYCTQPITD